MKQLYRLFFILSLAVFFISCATGGRAVSASPSSSSLPKPVSSDYTGFADLNYLMATLGEEPLESVEAYLQALEDNSSLLPEFDRDRGKEAEYNASYSAYKKLHDVREVVLIGQLARAFPAAPELEELLLRRFELNRAVWQLDILPEVEAYAKRYAGKEEKVRKAWYWYADGRISRNYRKPEPIKSAIALFKERYPESPDLLKLYQTAVRYLTGTDAQEELSKEMEQDFPDAEETLRAQEQVRQEAEKKKLLGKPFELRFKDQLTGRTIDTKDLRGKVLVIDFWATWCGPCVVEVPHMIDLYEKYRNRGVEFIGISLDRKASTLVDFCEEQGITWPQYCEEGKTWDTDFSKQWLINAVPTIYIVDQSGKLYALDGRRKIGSYLDELL
jgi:thiol-disulfide isomerase/thioredoxin